jgi:hypothetical protein
MRRSAICMTILALTVGNLLLTACVLQPVRAISPSGVVVTQVLDFAQFERISVRNAFQVNIRQGDRYSVIVEVDEAVLPYLQVIKQENTLQIGLERGIGVRGNMRLRAEVIMPRLTGIRASGASRADFAGFRSTDALEMQASGASTLQGAIDGGNTEIEASGASHVTLGGVYQELRVRASGASRITLTGEGQDASIHGSGASTVDMTGLPLANVSITASGASRVSVTTRGLLNADASGGSTVTYLGEPRMGTIQESGGSSVRPQ